MSCIIYMHRFLLKSNQSISSSSIDFSLVVHSPKRLAHFSVKNEKYDVRCSRLFLARFGINPHKVEGIPIRIKYNGPKNKDCTVCPYSCTKSLLKSSSSVNTPVNFSAKYGRSVMNMNIPSETLDFPFHLVTIEPWYVKCSFFRLTQNKNNPRTVCKQPQVH